MKIKKCFYFCFLLVGMTFLVSCEKESNNTECAECDKVTYENGSETDREYDGEYCGENLEDKENEESSLGTKTITYECES